MMEERKIQTTSVSLHVIAMAIMLIDHFKMVFPDVALLPSVGRIAFPIFAFLIVEGYFHTRNLGKYAQRLLLFAILAEIPADLMSRGQCLYEGHQNVLWTFLIGLGLICINEKAKETEKPLLRVLAAVGTVVVGYYVGMITKVDYSQAGVLTVLTFYFFRGRKWWCYAGQLVSLVYLHCVELGGAMLTFPLFGQTVSFPRQGLALLALIPIWFYRGEQGRKTKWFQYFCYAFYPVHMLVVAVLAGNASPKLLTALLVPVACVLLWRVLGEKVRGALKKWSDKNLAKLLVDVAAILLIAAPVVSLFSPVPDVVWVQYFEDQTSLQQAMGAVKKNPMAIKSWPAITDVELTKEWYDLYEEASPAEKVSKFVAWSRPFPCYMVIFGRGGQQVAYVMLTEREVVFAKLFQKEQYIGYTPHNPYFDRAGELYAAMGAK